MYNERDGGFEKFRPEVVFDFSKSSKPYISAPASMRNDFVNFSSFFICFIFIAHFWQTYEVLFIAHFVSVLIDRQNDISRGWAARQRVLKNTSS